MSATDPMPATSESPLSKVPSSVLNAELLCRAYNRAAREIVRLEGVVAGMKRKQERRYFEMCRGLHAQRKREVPRA